MSFFDNISKTISKGVDRAKFEAEKLQKTLRLQSELGELKRQFDTKRQEFGDRALELYKAGQIQSATLGEIARAIEGLRASMVLKEEELKNAQTDNFVEPPSSTPTASHPPQNVPISVEPPSAPATQSGPDAATKTCPNCSFQMPSRALFCPNCGARVGA